MSLYGIETEADCRKEIDELLAMVDHAEQTLTIGSTTAKPAMEVLKSRLEELYKKSNHTNEGHMSAVEVAYFRPAIQEAYVNAPKLSSPRTWPGGLEEIRMNLRYRRPANKKENKKKSR
jgi:ElaB/YqjD/DUF883 family membrane-anchored ribosome-binding protein